MTLSEVFLTVAGWLALTLLNHILGSLGNMLVRYLDGRWLPQRPRVAFIGSVGRESHFSGDGEKVGR